jgi:hypothetical protein
MYQHTPEFIMRRRRLLLVALSVAIVLLGLGGWGLWSANANAVRPGMSRAEVESRLGEPLGTLQYDDGRTWVLWWVGYELRVRFDSDGPDGVVTEVDRDPLFELILRWLRLEDEACC